MLGARFGWKDRILNFFFLLFSRLSFTDSFFQLIFITVSLIYSSVFISALQQIESYIYIYIYLSKFFRLFSHIGLYRVLGLNPGSIPGLERSGGGNGNIL